MWQKVVKASIYLLVFLLPIFWLPTSFEAFEFNKTYLLLILVGLGFLAWLARMVFEDKKIRFKSGPLDIFVLVFLLISILNIAFSVDRVSTIFGFYGRFWPNFIGIAGLAIFYFILSNNIDIESKEKGAITIKGITKTFLWSSFLVFITSCFSLFGIWSKLVGPLRLSGIMSFKAFNPVGGSFEQLSIFLSIVFVFLLIKTAFNGFRQISASAKPGQAEKRNDFWAKAFLLVIFLFLAIIDFWPSFFVIFFSLVVFLVFSFWKRIFKEDVNRLSLTILFLIISAIFLFSNPFKGFIQQTEIFGNVPEEIQLPQGTSWKIAFNGLKEGPVFGSGNSTFNYIFSKHKPDSFVKGPFWYIRFDRASNHISEVIGTNGILGILSYLALIGMFLMVCWLVVSSKSSESKLNIQVPLIISFIAVFSSQFVFYQNITLAFVFWIFLALAVISWDKPQKEKVIVFRDFPELGLVITILFWSALIGLGIFYFSMAKIYIADAYYRNFLINPAENILKLEKAVKLDDARADYHIALAGAYLDSISNELSKSQQDNQQIIGLVALSIKEGRRAAEVSPKRIAAQEALGVVYRDIRGLAQGALEWGIKTFEIAIETEPKNPILLTELGRLLLADNKREEAKTLFNKALELRDSYVTAGIQLASMDEEDGKIKEAIEKLENLVSQNPFSIDAHFQLGRIYFNQKYYTEAIEEFQSIIQIFPDHSNAHYSLGLIYELKGQEAKALEEFRKVLELNPGNSIIIQKINQLVNKPEEKEK